MALVGPRSNVVSPHGIVVDRSSRPDGTDIKIIDYGEVLETFILSDQIKKLDRESFF